MIKSLELINRIQDELVQVLRWESRPARKGRRLIGALCPVLGARSGALFAWEAGGHLVLCATRGMTPESARKLRRVVQSPPSCPGEPLSRLGWATVGRGKGVRSGWVNFDRRVKAMARETPLVVWPLSWVGGSGLWVLCMEDTPHWPAGFAQAAAGQISLGLNGLLMQSRAETSGADYRRIFENSRDMVYLSSRDGSWQEVNQAGVEMLGYDSKEQLLSVPDSAQAAYLDPRDRAAFRAAIEKDGFVKDYEVTFQRRNGQPIDVAITAQVRTDNGEIRGYEGIIKDITSRKAAEAQAHREQRLISAILEAVPLALFVLDNSHRVSHWNRACEELTGVKREDILGTDQVWKVFNRSPGVSLADVVLQQDEAKMRQVYGRERLRPSPLGQGAWEAEAHFDDLGGRPKDLIFSAALLTGPDGTVEGAVEAILDSTQIKSLERSLAESEQLYRTLVESNQEGIALHDGDRFLFANPAFMEMFGLEGLESAGEDFLELISDSCRLDYLEWVKDLRSRGGVLPVFEAQGVRGEGSFDLEMTAAPATLDGKPATLFTVRDVTFRKRMEEQLIRSERLAATGKLAFDIAHEVNNPLGGILTYAHLMAEEMEPDSDLAVTVDKIIKLTNRCKIIVRGLLDFARQDPPENQPVQLNQVVREMLSLMDGHVILRGVVVCLDLDERLPSVYGQRSKLEQVFLNMIINAAEAMEGSGRLSISTRHDVPTRQVEVNITDNGPGMDPEVAARIFEPFYTTKGRGRGTGLGLSISHGIVTQHGGDIKVDTVPGKGTSITICVPLDHTGSQVWASPEGSECFT